MHNLLSDIAQRSGATSPLLDNRIGVIFPILDLSLRHSLISIHIQRSLSPFSTFTVVLHKIEDIHTFKYTKVKIRKKYVGH